MDPNRNLRFKQNFLLKLHRLHFLLSPPFFFLSRYNVKYIWNHGGLLLCFVIKQIVPPFYNHFIIILSLLLNLPMSLSPNFF